MSISHPDLTEARQRATAAAAMLAAAGAPLLVVLILLTRADQLFWALPVLPVALLVTGGVQAPRGRAAMPCLAAGLVLLLIAAGPFAAELPPWRDSADQQGVPVALPLGCVGLVGCVAAWRWLRRGGSAWFGTMGWLGGMLNPAGTGLCVLAYTSAGDGADDWAALGYILLGGFCALVGCVLMLIGAIAMVVSVRRSPGSGQAVRSLAARPVGGR